MKSFLKVQDSLLAFIHNKIKYPELERENGDKRKLIISFTIDKQGKLDSVKIAKGDQRGCPGFYKEFNSVFNSLPSKQIKLVAGKYYLAFRFSLTYHEKSIGLRNGEIAVKATMIELIDQNIRQQ